MNRQNRNHIVENEFKEGPINGTVKLTWLDQNIEMTSHAINGQLHGMFKAHDKTNDQWMIGTLFQNELVKSSHVNCWIIEKQMVNTIQHSFDVKSFSVYVAF